MRQEPNDNPCFSKNFHFVFLLFSSELGSSRTSRTLRSEQKKKKKVDQQWRFTMFIIPMELLFLNPRWNGTWSSTMLKQTSVVRDEEKHWSEKIKKSKMRKREKKGRKLVEKTLNWVHSDSIYYSNYRYNVFAVSFMKNQHFTIILICSAQCTHPEKVFAFSLFLCFSLWNRGVCYIPKKVKRVFNENFSPKNIYFIHWLKTFFLFLVKPKIRLIFSK